MHSFSYAIGMSDFSALLSLWFLLSNVMGFARFEISKPPVAREMRGQRRLSRDSCGFEVYVEISLDVDEFLFIYFLGD